MRKRGKSSKPQEVQQPNTTLDPLEALVQEIERQSRILVAPLEQAQKCLTEGIELMRQGKWTEAVEKFLKMEENWQTAYQRREESRSVVRSVRGLAALLRRAAEMSQGVIDAEFSTPYKPLSLP